MAQQDPQHLSGLKVPHPTSPAGRFSEPLRGRRQHPPGTISPPSPQLPPFPGLCSKVVPGGRRLLSVFSTPPGEPGGLPGSQLAPSPSLLKDGCPLVSSPALDSVAQRAGGSPPPALLWDVGPSHDPPGSWCWASCLERPSARDCQGSQWGLAMPSRPRGPV